MNEPYPPGVFPCSDEFLAGIDPGVREYVRALRERGVHTCQSCQGGVGHAYRLPTVDFIGDEDEGWRVLHDVLTAGLPVHRLSRQWLVDERLGTGEDEATWRMEFERPKDGFRFTYNQAFPLPRLVNNAVIVFEDEAISCMGINAAREFAGMILAACLLVESETPDEPKETP